MAQWLAKRRINFASSGFSNSLVLALALSLAYPTLLWAQPGPQEPAENSIIYHRDRSFRIPFRVQPTTAPRVAEVQLHYSRDRGRTWEHYSSARPEELGFVFHAAGDGEYWFAVRTKDPQDQLSPSSLEGLPPMLRVTVDTVPPRVEMRGLNPVGDQIGVEWRVDDTDLDLDSMQIEYRGSQGDWMTVPGVSRSRTGRVTWRPEAGGPLEIRLRILDLAKNEGIQTINLGAPQGIPAVGGGARGPLGSNFASDSGGDFQLPNRPRVPNSPYASSDPSSQGSREVSRQDLRPLDNPNRPFDGQNGNFVPPASPLDARREAEPTIPRAPASKVNTMLVNSTRFAIEYDVEELGKSGLSSVALYYLNPRNYTWEYYGEDEDRESPFLVEVDGEGIYGISLVAKNGAGLGSEPPAPGERPQIWIEVDLTPPETTLYPPEPGRGTMAGLLNIAWGVQDRNLASKAVSIYYAETASGPWTPIVEEIANTGRYQWKIPEEVPYKFYVRLEAKDRAGNVGRAETDRPVIVDLSRPRLKIRNVIPNPSMPTGLLDRE